MNKERKKAIIRTLPVLFLVLGAQADEQLFGYVKGAEVLPQGAQAVVVQGTYRGDKGAGSYNAFNTQIEYEYGISDRFEMEASLKFQSIDMSGLEVDGYLPKDESYAFKPSGAELSGKYMFLSPALAPFGLAGYWSFDYDWLDPHSGQDKRTLSMEMDMIAQKYFLDGQMIWAANAGYEATHATRDEINDLPPGFEWPTDPEMEIELKFGTGISYRFAPGWFVGAETLYETEYETEVGQERWSVFAGPNLHYASEKWWITLSWMPQLKGGGERFDEQDDSNLHLIEKTKQEARLKFGFNF